MRIKRFGAMRFQGFNIWWIPETMVTALFTYSAADKWAHQENFLATLLKVFYLPIGWVVPLSYGIPLVEMLLVGLTFSKSFGKCGLVGLAALLIIFSVHLVVMHVFNPGVPCSCGGLIDAFSLTQHLFFNGASLLLCLMLIRGYKNR